MSQIASAFVVSQVQLRELDEIAARKDWKAFLNLLRKEAKTVKPEYSYSGYVIAVLIPFLDEKGVVFPPPDSLHTNAQSCITQKDAKVLCEQLKNIEIEITDEELAEFYNEFTQDPFNDAGDAMREGIEFLLRGCEMITSADSVLLLFVG